MCARNELKDREDVRKEGYSSTSKPTTASPTPDSCHLMVPLRLERGRREREEEKEEEEEKERKG